MKRPFTQDELQDLIAKGYDMSSYGGQPVDFPDESSMGGAVGRSALTSIIPGITGGAGFGLTMMALAPETFGASLLAIPAAAGVGYLTGKLGQKTQEPLMSDQFKQQLAADAALHPIATTLTGAGTAALAGGFNPSPSNLAKAGGAIGRLATRLPTTLPERMALVNVGAGSALGGIQEAVTAPLEGREITPGGIALAAGSGALFSRPNALGRAYGFHNVATPVTLDPTALTATMAKSAQEQKRPAFAKVEQPPIFSPQEQIDRSVGLTVRPRSAEESAKAMFQAEKEGKPIVTRDTDAEFNKLINEKTKKAAEAAKKAEIIPPAKTEVDVIPAPKQKEAPIGSTLKEEVAAGLKSKGISGAVTPEYVDALTREILNERGIQVQPDGSLPLSGRALFDGATRKILFNPSNAGLDTLPHEGVHHLRFDLEDAASKGDRRSAALLAKWDELTKPEMDKINAQRVEKGQEPFPDTHEFAVSQQGYEFVKRQLNLAGETPWKRWWNDTKALFNAKYNTGKISIEDLRRAINFKFVNERSKMTVTPGGSREQPSDESLAPENKGYRLVNLRKPDGSIEEVYFNDKYYGDDVAKMLGFRPASIARLTEQGLSHGATKKGETIEEIGRNQPSEESLANKRLRDAAYNERNKEKKREQMRVIAERNAAELADIRGETGARSAGVKPHTYPQDKEQVASILAAPRRRTPLSEMVNLEDKEGLRHLDEYIRRAVYTAANRIRAEERGAELPPTYSKETGRGMNRDDYAEIQAAVKTDLLANGVDRDSIQGPGAIAIRRSIYRRARDAWKAAIAEKSKVKRDTSLETPLSEDKTLADVTTTKAEVSRQTVIPKVKEGMSKAEMVKAKIVALEEERAQAVADYGEGSDAVKEIDNELNVWEGRAQPKEESLSSATEEKLSLNPEWRQDQKEEQDLLYRPRPMTEAEKKFREMHEAIDKGQSIGESLRSYVEGKQSFFEPMAGTFDKIRKLDPEIGPVLAQAFHNYDARRQQYLGWGQEAIKKLQKYKLPDLERVTKQMTESDDARAKMPSFVGKDKEIADAIHQLFYEDFGKERVNHGPKIDGREAGMRDTYVPQMLNEQSLHTLTTKPNSPEAKYIKNQWAKHVAEKSDGEIPESEALDHINNYVRAIGGGSEHYLSVNFGAIRKTSGYGLPANLRETNPLKIVSRYTRRAASDLAMFRELESRPEIAAALNIPNPDTGKIPDHPNREMNLSDTKEVKNAMKWVTDSFGNTLSKSQPYVNSIVRLVHNSLMGAPTGIRDIVSVPVNSIPYINKFSDLSAAMTGLAMFRENSAAALRHAATQPNFDLVQFNMLRESPTAGLALINKVATGMRKWQGRELLENTARDITFSVGRELAKNNIAALKAGSDKGDWFLKKFSTLVDGDVTKMEGPELEAAINQMAKNFTDRVQGTFSGRGLPVGVVESQFAPFFSLQKWSIEKSNVIWQDVFKPFLTGENRMPLLTYTLGSFLTGAAIQEINKALSGRKPQDPDIKEALAKGDAKSYAAELATLMQLGSYAGIVGDAAKATSDIILRGKKPRNVVSFPTATAAIDTQERLTYAFEAFRQGEDPWSVVKALSLDLMSNNIQNARMILNHTVKDEDIERSDKFRDLRIYNELEGKPATDMVRPNKYLGIEERRFKQANTAAEIRESLPKVLQRAKEKAAGNPEKLRAAIVSLKANSYQTMPSPLERPFEFKAYYDYLVRTQGKVEADKRVKDYLMQKMLNQQKSQLIPSLRR